MKRILASLLASLSIGAAACGAFPDPTPTPEALAVVGRWEGYLDGQALHITVEPAGLGGAQIDPQGFGSSILKGDGLWMGRDVLVMGRTTPDSILFVVYTDFGPVDLHLARRDSTELRGVYGLGRSSITLRRSRS
jgi:hypothetical protein